MKKYKGFLLMMLCAVLLACAAQAASEFVRAPTKRGFMEADKLAKQYGVELTKGVPLYTPKSPQPLNAYMVTHPECEVGINRSGRYKVSEKGLVPSITDELKEWMVEIEEQSQGLIRFVGSPDNADILIVAKQSYFFHGNYRGGGITSKGYGCSVRLEAVRLTASVKSAVLSMKNTPGKKVSTYSSSEFWMLPPELEETKEFRNFVKTMLGWYGYGAAKGSKGAGVTALKTALVARGLLSEATGAFNAKTKEAIMQLQKMKGLDVTGKVDGKTLLALYYDK